MNIRKAILALCICVAAVTTGCKIGHHHDTFHRMTAVNKNDSHGIFPTLVATGYGDMAGNRSGPPYRLKLVVECSTQTSAALEVRSAYIKDGTNHIDIVDASHPESIAMQRIGSGDMYANVVIPKDIKVPFVHGKTVELFLDLLLIRDGTNTLEIKRSFLFEGKTNEGKTRFNPIFDIT